MKASDISDAEFIAALNPDGKWTNLDDIAERLNVPWKVAKAKARTMILKRKTVDGCYCGCRGDFHLVGTTPKREEDEWTSLTSVLERLTRGLGRAS